MQTENWKQIKELLQEAMSLAPEKRERFLIDSGASAAVRAEVESLLAFEEESENLMRLSAVEFSKDFFENETGAANHLIGQNFGAYQIVRELGQGGMGAVYLATRTDGKFKQQVALKLLKREMNTAALRRRFEQEREILASLEHPNIARLLDAGTTDDKIPFLAMEYVEGLPVDEYCLLNHLDLNQRLDLFRKVCSAVSFAHRNLIVHRDLKPSNIIVNKEGLPKLLDFGISKILVAEFEQVNASTVTKLGVMTPSYASPEQLQNKSVTTATDIYSLGVILYELLSGHRPFEAKENDIKEIYKAVLETEPPPPSALINTHSKKLKEPTEAKTELLAPDDSKPATKTNNFANDTEANRTRQTVSPTVNLNAQSLRGDLDNIVLKALRKEPERRYSSAETFADDIHRHQRGLPVTARPNTFSYRAEKFIKRNRASVFAGIIIVLAIIAGVIATLWQWGIARAERVKAENRFNDVRALANSFLFEFSPKIENLPGSMPARQLLVTRALEYLDNLSKESSDDLQLQNELAKAYEKVGDVQGNPDTPNIGDLKGALASYEKAQAMRRVLSGREPDNAEMDANLASNLEVAANINLNGGEFDKAETILDEAVALREKVVARSPKALDARGNLAKALRVRSFVPFYNAENEKANEFIFRSMAIYAELVKESPDDPTFAYQYANTFVDLGDSYGYLDQTKLAEENIQKGLDMLVALSAKHPNDIRVRRALMVAHMKRGEYYRDSEDYKNSLVKYDAALDIARNALALEPGSFQARRDVVMVNKQRAITLKTANRMKDSLDSFASAIEISEQLKKEDPNNILIIYDIASSYYEMSETHFSLGDFQAALTTLQKTVDNCREVLDKNPAHTQSLKVTAKAKRLTGDIHAATAVKNGRTDSWRKALENYQAGLQIYSQLKAEGKSAAPDAKAIADLETEIGKIESRLGKS